MESYSVYLPSYTIGGGDVYKKVPEICRPYGTKVVVIGGKTALEKSKDAIIEGVADSELELVDFIVYGDDSTYENVDALVAMEVVKNADMIFGVGGGRALDTVKVVADRVDKPIFTFPTIASNCAPVTIVCVMYNADHTFKELTFTKRPAVHTFINTKIIAESPDQYFWAGIGDALSKQYESTFKARGVDLSHSDQLGVDIARNCAAPMLKYGAQAMADKEAGQVSDALAQVILNIIVTTGMVSVLVDNTYNSALGHAIYYGTTVLPHVEENHLHGELVSYGVLVLLTLDEQKENLDQVYAFNRSVKLPTCLADIEVNSDDLEKVLDQVMEKKDLVGSPYTITREAVKKAIMDLEDYHAKHA